MERFYLDEYVKQKGVKIEKISAKGEDTKEQNKRAINESSQAENFESDEIKKESSFRKLCMLIDERFSAEWEESTERTELLRLQKNAIMGYKNESEYFKKKIGGYLKELEGVDHYYPPYYQNIEEAIYHELWGLAGIAEWFSVKYSDSSSAKIIGNRIYFMENGKLKLKPQRISDERRGQLIRAFLLTKPDEKMANDFHELYMPDGTRITIFRHGLVKESEEVIIFRRYIVPAYTFEEQEMRGTIPIGSSKLFENMVRLGFNCAFVGEIRSAKTTFLTTWQSYEDESLEGVLVETDPEIPLHSIMPKAPIIQLVADGKRLEMIVKNLMRSDADYFVLGEARDAVALSTALRIASKGGRRLKMTFHLRNPMDFPYDVASEIANGLGGDVDRLALSTACAFDYIFHFGQLRDKSKKRLLGIYQMSAKKSTGEIMIDQICEYDYKNDSWRWKESIDSDKEKRAMIEDELSYIEFCKELAHLAHDHPMQYHRQPNKANRDTKREEEK